MSRNDDGFNLDDMMEIFGDAVPAAPKAVATQAPPPPAPAPTPKAEAPIELNLDADELAILEAYEKQKQEKRQREADAQKKKEEEAKRILEEYERAQKEAAEKESRARAEAEAKRQKELEELKRKEEFKLDAERMAEEERKIIEEFEREAAAQKAKQEAERQAKEAAAQAELQRLAEQQRAEEAKRAADEAAREAEFQAQAQAQAVSKKDSRMLELLAKAQQDIQANGLPPLPGGGAVPAAAPAAAGGPKASDVILDIEMKENDAFCGMLDETRKAMFTFLAPLIGIKASNNMLNKSVEKARAKAPVVLKDANWRMDGSLREDGSVDPERLQKNAAMLPAGTRVDDYLAGLHELLTIRFKAVEAGLGATTAGEMRNRVLATREPLSKGKIPTDWVKLFFDQVVAEHPSRN